MSFHCSEPLFYTPLCNTGVGTVKFNFLLCQLNFCWTPPIEGEEFNEGKEGKTILPFLICLLCLSAPQSNSSSFQRWHLVKVYSSFWSLPINTSPTYQYPLLMYLPVPALQDLSPKLLVSSNHNLHLLFPQL